MPHSAVLRMENGLIPVIDIAPLRDGSNPQIVSDALHRASREVGFIYITNHGIREDTIETARTAGLDFFRHAAADKQSVAVSSAHRGYLGRGGAKMYDTAKADLKESFIWGYENALGKTPDDHPLRGANRWPDFMPDLQAIAMDYFGHVHEVAGHLMRGFALGLGLDEDTFLKSSEKPLSRASFVYYPPQTDADGDQFGVGPHTDFGVLTVLCQDSVGGLEVESLDGEWIAAPPIPGTLIVNVGDLLARWTKGAYRSTPHRVINRSGRERLSLVLAYDPEPQTMIDPRDIFGPDCELTEPPITCGDYLSWRFEKAFSYRADPAA